MPCLTAEPPQPAVAITVQWLNAPAMIEAPPIGDAPPASASLCRHADDVAGAQRAIPRQRYDRYAIGLEGIEFTSPAVLACTRAAVAASFETKGLASGM